MISVVRLFILGDLVRMGRQEYFLKMTTTIMYPRLKNTTEHIYWYLERNPQNPNFQTGHGRAFTRNLLSDYLDIIAICRSGTLGLGGYNYLQKKNVSYHIGSLDLQHPARDFLSVKQFPLFSDSILNIFSSYDNWNKNKNIIFVFISL